MKTQAIYEEKIPDYALSYLINNDDSGLSSEDKKIIDNYMNQFYQKAESYKNGGVYIELVDPNIAESYFTWSPAFGLACNVYDCTITILSE